MYYLDSKPVTLVEHRAPEVRQLEIVYADSAAKYRSLTDDPHAPPQRLAAINTRACVCANRLAPA